MIALLDERINSAQIAIASAKESRDNETKSSVGDKYETGRTLMQQEVEKNRIQLYKAERVKIELGRINLKLQSTRVEFGSLVTCNNNSYFISTALGKIEVEGKKYFCISPASPLGKTLLNKCGGDKVDFRGETFEIQSIE